MTTHTIVAKDKDPLGSNEINAGDPISMTDGDVFVIDPSADSNITFHAAGGSITFDIQVNASNANDFTTKVEDGLNANLKIEGNANLSDVDIDVKSAKSVEMGTGDDVS